MSIGKFIKSNIFHNRYRILCTLGKGNFGKVYLAEDINDKKKVAIKVVDKRLFKNNDQKQHAQREQSICHDFATDLVHDHIVKIYNVVSDHEYIYITMEYIEGGELFEKIKHYKRLTEPLARRWFRELVEAIYYIHKNGIVHRDLKPENVLIDRNKKVKLCDFGFGKRIESDQEILNTYCGSPFYASPEMVTATPYKGPPVDMWSCGVILYAMLTGTLPFRGQDMPQLFKKINKGIYITPKYISPEAANLLKCLLCKSAKDRITAADCLDHPWLQFSSATKLISTSSSLSQSLILSAYYEQQKQQKRKQQRLKQHNSNSSNNDNNDNNYNNYNNYNNTNYNNNNHNNNMMAKKINKGDHHHYMKKEKPISANQNNEVSPEINLKNKTSKKGICWLLYHKKSTQVVPSPSSIIEDHDYKRQPKKMIYKLSEFKIIHQFKNLFRNTFQKRIKVKCGI
ncbi:unnamed protein product [Cunninghamella blakesleeana]